MPQTTLTLRPRQTSLNQTDKPKLQLQPRGQSENVGSYKPYNDMTKEERDADRERFWDSVPVWYKKAYNQSLGGMMHEMMTGRKYYDLKNAPPNQVEDFVATIAAFFASKEDLALMATSGGTASIAGRVALTKIAGKQASKGLVERRVAAQLARNKHILQNSKNYCRRCCRTRSTSNGNSWYTRRII